MSSSLQGPLFWNLSCSVRAFSVAGLDPETDPAAVDRQRYRQIEGGADQKSNLVVEKNNSLNQLWQAGNFRNSIEVFVRKYLYIHLYRHMYFIMIGIANGFLMLIVT